MRYLVGARYACATCRTRYIRAHCERCGERTRVLDLTREDDRTRLTTRSRSAFLETSRPWEWPLPRLLFWLLRCAGALGGAILGAYLGRHQAFVLQGLMALSCAFALYVGVHLLVAVPVLALLGLSGLAGLGIDALTALAALFTKLPIAPIAHLASRAWLALVPLRDRDLLERLTAWIEQVDHASVRIGTLPAPGVQPPIDGVLRFAPGDGIVLFGDASRAIAVCDAVAPAFELVTDDGRAVRVEIEAGAIDAVRTSGVWIESVPLPSWLGAIVGRPTIAEALRIDGGTRVRVEGGERTEVSGTPGADAGYRSHSVTLSVRGNPDAPLLLRVVAG